MKRTLPAVIVALVIATIVALADTGRLTPILVWVHALPMGDKLGHLTLMGLLACVVEVATGARCVAIARVPIRVGSAVVLAVVVLEELSQQWVPTRSFDDGDLAADVLGIAIGGGLGALVAHRLARGSLRGPRDGRYSQTSTVSGARVR